MKEIGQLNIGPLRFRLLGEALPDVYYPAPGYRGFFRTSSSCPRADAEDRAIRAFPPLIDIPVYIGQDVATPPDARADYIAGDHWSAWCEPDGWRFHVGLKRPPSLQSAGFVAHALDRATVQVASHPHRSPLQYPLDQIFAWPLLARCGGVLVHAAGVVRNGCGYLLAGRSGAGKSTLSALCHADGWTILNDDRMAVFRRNDAPRMAGTPWHGSGRFAQPGETPLAGIFLLRHGTRNAATRVTPDEARMAMLEVAAIPWFADDWSQQSLAALESLIQSVPVYRLAFTRDAEAVKCLTEKAEK